MSRTWPTALPIAIIVLFLVGYPCRSMMLSAQAPAHDCCEDCGDATQAPSQGCQTLCVAFANRIVLQSADDSATGVPADVGLVYLVEPDALILPVVAAGATVSVPREVPPLYLQNASLLI